MSYKDYLAVDKFPTIWCPGCALGILLKETAHAFNDLGFKKENIVTVSGIGCTGRSSGYFSNDSIHTPHGRPIPVAEGVKGANPEMNVVVISGDGDLLGIGGNHLLHSARRDANITVICVSNEVYGLTGGQMAPTTKTGAKTLTSPKGSTIVPMNVQGLLTLNKKHFYARTSAYHLPHMRKCIKEALEWDGFSFVEVITMCMTNYARRLGYKTNYEILMQLKKDFQVKSGEGLLADNEIGIVKHD
ncbi:MAG: thiamine pyrophosphate-dependent enzyme [archaeon]